MGVHRPQPLAPRARHGHPVRRRPQRHSAAAHVHRRGQAPHRVQLGRLRDRGGAAAAQRPQDHAGRHPDGVPVALRAAGGQQHEGGLEPGRARGGDQRVQGQAVCHGQQPPVHPDGVGPHVRGAPQQGPGDHAAGPHRPAAVRHLHHPREGRGADQAPAGRQPPQGHGAAGPPDGDLVGHHLLRWQVRVHGGRARLLREPVGHQRGPAEGPGRAPHRGPLHRRCGGGQGRGLHEGDHRLLLLRADPQSGGGDHRQAEDRGEDPIHTGA
mmetsp:Transcript_70184/g.117070  ORF Transcript_70184/g.117070 Transcript_70184/m.117070 type:complete len:268 (+) Transcript_70184:1624-2427(+)